MGSDDATKSAVSASKPRLLAPARRGIVMHAQPLKLFVALLGRFLANQSNLARQAGLFDCVTLEALLP